METFSSRFIAAKEEEEEKIEEEWFELGVWKVIGKF